MCDNHTITSVGMPMSTFEEVNGNLILASGTVEQETKTASFGSQTFLA